MSSKSTRVPRRDLLKAAGLAAGVVGLGGVAEAFPTKPTNRGGMRAGEKTRVLRIAHLTDMHVQPELEAERWFGDCLRHVQELEDKPDIIFQGGDAIMDGLGVGVPRARLQWDLFKKIMRSSCSLPVEHCIGNHDVWGWNQQKSGATGRENLYGKAWAMEALDLKERYRSFDKAGWHFIVLDSTMNAAEKIYTARLDQEQFAWLQQDLERTDKETPILIMSHIPIISASAYFDEENEKTGVWMVPDKWMHIDARRIKNLLGKYKNIKVCISGHIHLVDRVDYNGISYLCNGAVCGNWWKGPYQEYPPGYAVINLYADGSFDHEYKAYGWQGTGG
ncbi:MAG: metallophosphoesterase [Candidatus Sumerlaeaceae bacterium]|nr:metallophosphoesterase [Candidatus Sumerlaeaceae bacterium]